MNKIYLIFLILFFTVNTSFSAIIRDEFIENHLKSKQLPKIETNTEYNYEDTQSVLIKLQIDKEVKSTDLQPGDTLKFYVKQNVKYNKKLLIKMDTEVTATVKASTTRGMNGIPGQIIIDDFKIPGIDESKIKSTYIKRGPDRTIFVLPLKYALTPFFPLGTLTNFLIGGNAKITKNDTIPIYYYPNWNL